MVVTSTKISTVDVLCPMEDCRTVIHVPIMAMHLSDIVDGQEVRLVEVFTDQNNLQAHARWHRETLEQKERNEEFSLSLHGVEGLKKVSFP